MELQIAAVNDKGYLFKENLCLKVLKDCNLNEYMVLVKPASSSEEGVYTSKKRYKFESVKVKKGDVIYLNTDEGVNRKKVNKKSASEFVFYWGLSDTIWGNKSYTPTLAKVEAE